MLLILKVGKLLRIKDFFLVLGLGQIVATLLILKVGKLLRIVKYPDLGADTFKKVREYLFLYIF
jgi:hypothetical protein